MRTLGIDLAASPRETAACWIDWSSAPAVASLVDDRLDNDTLLGLMPSADKVGIDAPFGWPDCFLEAVRRHRDDHQWPFERPDRNENQRANAVRRLRYRATDVFVTKQPDVRRPPLSVSSDLIGVTAMRCAALLTRYAATAPVDRAGLDGRVVEVYPAAALDVWQLSGGASYKRRDGRSEREKLMTKLKRRFGRSLDIRRVRASCLDSDHALNAVVCGLVARAAAGGATWRPSDGRVSVGQAKREGWLHLPRPGTLKMLVGD